MKIQTITVTAGRTFNHPHEQYSNLRPEVTMVATLEEGEDPAAATKQLQQTAETLVEEHKRAMLQSIEDLAMMTRAQSELRQLGSLIAEQQRRVEELRTRHPELNLEGGR